MGTWGVELFQNDVALEVRDLYIKKLQVGKSNAEAFNEMLTELSDMVADPDDQIDFWFAIASLMYDYGRLTPDVKNKALDIINQKNDEERWDDNDKKKRNHVIESLKDKLITPQPDEVKIKVAMGNSNPELKKLATHITKSVNEHGVYEFLYEFFCK